MLNDLNFKLNYRSDRDTLNEDFFIPCLNEATIYDRASGYFTSESFSVLSKGLESFLQKDGKIRIVANPRLTLEDIEAIDKGYKAKDKIIEESLIREIELTSKNIENNPLDIIAWLIYLEKLEIKIAFTKNNSIYHEKFGIFTDEEGTSVAFSGSANETYSGLTQNFEKVDVYFGDNDSKRIIGIHEDFEKLWTNNTKSLEIIDIPDVVIEKIMKYKSKKIPVLTYKKDKNIFIPREYQKNAIDSWIENNRKGILEMATGTGKTITSLLASKKVLEIDKKVFNIIIVPFQHLFGQWEKDIVKIYSGFIINCNSMNKKWRIELKNTIRDFNIGLKNEVFVITTYETARSVDFKDRVKKIVGNALLISDECHYITTSTYKDFPFEKFQSRLGLSATPNRWWDETGTTFINKAIGKVVFKYGLEEAIKNDKLTPYKYHPHIIDLTESEMEKYKKLTQQMINYLDKEDNDSKDKLKQLILKRAKIINKAENKINNFLEEIKKENLDKLTHTLVYCAPGTTNEITLKLSELGLKVSKFNSTVDNKDRQKLLKHFEEGSIQVLVAIKCLDEGVDIPVTKKAYFLSSTSNPREFIQRRGRVLRKSKNKLYAELHDFIVLPHSFGFDDFKNIAVKEMPRFVEFNRSSLNEYEAKLEVLEILEKYGLNELMYKDPWDVYKENQEVYNV